MTLILTHLSKFGIIHASDSNLTSAMNRSAGQAKKTFALDYLNAGLTVAGAYSVAGMAMDLWMQDFIRVQEANGTRPLSRFAEVLRSALEAQMLSQEKNGSMVHIAGYVESGGVQHPEFDYVRNVYGIDTSTGEYFDVRPAFAVSEDFWTRDCPRANLMAAFQSGIYMIYINGFASGRIGYLGLQATMNSFFESIWAQQNWKFRRPSSLAETVLFVKLYMSIIDTLFQVSDYDAPFIGGGCQIYEIPQPPNTATGC